MSNIPLADLPIELLQDHLLPYLPAQGLLRLASTNKFFAFLCNADAVWKRKLVADFNYSSTETARTGGWKVIYRGLHKPRVYVWGATGNGRLGSQIPRSSVYGGVPFPFQLKFPYPSTRIVSLSSGGMSFAALDSEGAIHVWGTLDGTAGYWNRNGFLGPGMMAQVPHKLILPTTIRSLSFGRLHMTALDAKKRVWNFTNWGRPFTFSSPLLQDPLSPPVQVESGWEFSSVLTAAGDVYVWWPFRDPLHKIVKKRGDAMSDASPQASTIQATKNKEVLCQTLDIEVGGDELRRLPGLPVLPTLGMTGEPEESKGRGSKKLPRIVQLAGLENHLVALTDRGHVLKFGILSDPGQETHEHGTWRWEYLPQFCDLVEVRKHSVFNQISTPDTMKITHITGNFRNFVAYSTGSSSSLVLIGQDSATPSSTADIKPELQHRSVISVSMGDWHSAALTAEGRVLTWGAFSAGALGLGDPAKLRGEAKALAAAQAARAARSNSAKAQGASGGSESMEVKGWVPREDSLLGKLPEAYLDTREWWTGDTTRRVEKPLEVRFEHGKREPREPFAFAIAAAGWHTGALVMDMNPTEGDDGGEGNDYLWEGERWDEVNEWDDFDEWYEDENPGNVPTVYGL